MLKPAKSFLVAGIFLACLGMMLPEQVDARGGGGGGHGGGGGGGGRGGFGGGGYSGGRGFSSGGAGFRGPAGGFSTPGAGGFARSSSGSWNGGHWNGGNWNGGHWNGGNWHGNWNGGGWWHGGWYGGRWGGPGWGWWIGPGYWGFANPWWYGGFPFWYASVGYGSYWNPYYTDPSLYGGYNYGAPIQQNNQASQDNDYFAASRAAFSAGNYPEALRDIEHAIVDMPGNPDVHQFHSLIFFAMGDYQRAAAIAHTVLESGPGWDWSVLQSFYPSPEVYTQQLRALEHYITEHGDQAATRFLLGYQYMMLNHLSAARRQLERVVALEPRDKLAANILTGLNSAPGAKPQGLPGAMPSTGSPSGLPSTPPTPPGGPSAGGNPQGSGTANQVPTLPAPPSPPAAPSAGGGALTGTFTSSPAPDVKIELTLQPDKHFTWKFTQGGQTQSFDGTYVRDGDSLVLSRQDGEKMDGTLKMRGDSSFQFRLKNTDPNDPGLEFGK